VAESRESERDMATEAGAKVEGRMFDVGEEKKCILGGCGVLCVDVCCAGDKLGQPVPAMGSRGVVMGIEAVCRSLRHINRRDEMQTVVADGRWRRRCDTCISIMDMSRKGGGGAGRDKMC
jgi:hypothetical protein